MSGPRVSIRLGTEGKAQVERDFVDIGDAGTAQAKRAAAAFDKAAADTERALERQAKAAQRLAAAGAINPTTGTAYDRSAKSAAASAAVFTKELERQEIEAKRLIASIDPLFAAQQRYAEQVARINAVKATGQLTEERYQQLLAAEKLQLDQATAAGARHAGMQGQMRMGMQQLGFQLGDIATQWSMGTRASVIFAQQSGQVIQAFQLMGGEGNKVLEFLRGPWGIALSVAAIALTPLIGKLFETSESLDDMVAKLAKEAEQSAKNDRAHEAFGKTLDGVRAAVGDYEKALKGLEDQGKSTAQKTLDQARASLAYLEVLRQTTVEMIKAAKAQNEYYNGSLAATDPRFKSQFTVAQDRIDQLEKTLGSLDDTKGRLQSVIDTAASFVAVERGSEGAVERIRRNADALVESTRKRLLAEHATTQEIERQTRAIRDRERADVEAEQKRNRKGPSEGRIEHAGGDTIQRAQIAAFFDEANKFRGTSEASASLQQFLTKALGKPLDPEKTAWCAAFVNAVLATEGVKGTGSPAARSFLNFGKDDTSSPQKGDIVIVRSAGSPSGAHVGFLESTDAKGNVRVLGGNTGNRVATMAVAAKDVLGIRRPPTPGELASGDAKDAEDAAKEAVKDFIRQLAVTAKVGIAEASRPLEDRGKALDFLDKENDRHKEAMSLLQAELGLAGQSQSKREEMLRLLQRELEIRRQYPGLSQAEIDKLVAQAKAEDDLREHIDQVVSSVEEFRRIGEDVLDTIFDPNNWKDWGDLGKRVLKELEADFIRLAALNPLKNLLFGGNLPTLAGALAGLFGGGFNTGPISLPGGPALPEFGDPGNINIFSASGSEYFPGGLTWAGEFGKELVRLPRGSKITPAAESRRLAAANDGSIGMVTVPITVDATGADPAAVARLNAKLDELQQSIPSLVVASFNDARQRNILR